MNHTGAVKVVALIEVYPYSNIRNSYLYLTVTVECLLRTLFWDGWTVWYWVWL